MYPLKFATWTIAKNMSRNDENQSVILKIIIITNAAGIGLEACELHFASRDLTINEQKITSIHYPQDENIPVHPLHMPIKAKQLKN